MSRLRHLEVTDLGFVSQPMLHSFAVALASLLGLQKLGLDFVWNSQKLNFTEILISLPLFRTWPLCVLRFQNITKSSKLFSSRCASSCPLFAFASVNVGSFSHIQQLKQVLDALFISSPRLAEFTFSLRSILPADAPLFSSAVRRLQHLRTFVCDSANGILPRMLPQLAADLPSLQSLSLRFWGMPKADMSKFLPVLPSFALFVRYLCMSLASASTWSIVIMMHMKSWRKSLSNVSSRVLSCLPFTELCAL